MKPDGPTLTPEAGRLWAQPGDHHAVHIASGHLSDRPPHAGSELALCGVVLGPGYWPLPPHPQKGPWWAYSRPGCVPCQREAGVTLVGQEPSEGRTEAVERRQPEPPPQRRRGWWNMACWNGLSPSQQGRLIAYGNLPLGYQPEGDCPNGAEVAIETESDLAPGPRFYCRACAIADLTHPENRRTST